MPRPLPITEGLVDRVLEIETENVISRLAPIAARPGNPSGVHIARFGRAVAFAAEGIRMDLYNSLLDVGPDLLEHLDDVEAFFAEHAAEGLLEIAPGRLTPEVGRALAQRGYAMTEFHVGLVRAIEPEDADLDLPEGVDVELVDARDAAAFATWVDTYKEGWGQDPTSREDLLTWAVNADPWRFYLARVEGEPAAAAVLDVRGRAALDASASTRPAFRGRRAQSALIRARVRDAARLGCDLLVGGAYFGTSSMRNHQRQGFSTAFTRGIWAPPKAPARDLTRHRNAVISSP